MTADQPGNKNKQIGILAVIAGAVLAVCCCGVVAVLVFGNIQYIRTVLATRSTSPNTPIPPIAVLTQTSEPGTQLPPTEIPTGEVPPAATTPVSPTTSANPASLILWITQKSDALNQQIALYQQSNAGVTISVTLVGPNNINDRWTQAVANGTAPDLMLADNTNLWKLVKAQAVQLLDTTVQTSMKGYSNTALNGMTIGGKQYGIPVRFELAGFYYNTSMIDNPPTTTAELSLLYRTGSKFGLVKSPYFMMGWFIAYGGAIADKNGRCISTPTGFEDAINLMRQIRKYGSFLVDDPTVIRDKFSAEQIGMIIDASSELPVYAKALGDHLASLPIPAATNPASPIVQETGFYLNPKSQNLKAATDAALSLSSAQAQTAYMGEYWIPTRADVKVTDPAIKGFVTGAQNGYPIPQAGWFDNWEGPFQDMINQVLTDQFDIPDAIQLACKKMDTLNNKLP
jgi:arabinogalactan oligomer / maltooligosaccharide transport system substrate-binding protein